MLKTKCECGLRYEYEDAEAGQTVTCECGKNVVFPAVPEKPLPKKTDERAERLASPSLVDFIRNPAADPRWNCLGCGGAFSETVKQYEFNGEKPFCSVCFDVRFMASVAPQRSGRADNVDENEPPRFGMLENIASALSVIGVLGCLIGALCVLIGLIYIVDSGKAPAAPATLIASGAASFFGGLVQIAIGQALECLRVIAVNSFYIRQQTKK